MPSTERSKLFGSIFDRMESKPSLLREYRAPVAARSSGVRAGRPASFEASVGRIATWVTFIESFGRGYLIILLTGFGPFGSHAENPSEWLARNAGHPFHV